MLGQQRNQLVPVEVVLGRAVQQQQRLALPRRDVMHPDAVGAGAPVLHRMPGMVEDLGQWLLPR